LKIDKNLHIPLYRQVEHVLEEKIKTGQWVIGYQVPTEQELADHFDVSTITVKRAIIDLVNKGYLYRQRGKGTFVSEFQKEQDINSMISLTTEEEGEHPHELISFMVVEAGEEISKKLDIPIDTKVFKLKRLKIESGEPTALEYTYLPYEKCPELTSDNINNELIYNILGSKFQIPLKRAKLFIKPHIAFGEQALLLKLEPGTPVFKWERFTYTKQEEKIEYSIFFVRHDKQTYYTEVFF
jgi:GntR family transcriptional regulator